MTTHRTMLLAGRIGALAAGIARATPRARRSRVRRGPSAPAQTSVPSPDLVRLSEAAGQWMAWLWMPLPPDDARPPREDD